MKLSFTIEQIEEAGIWHGRWHAQPSILDEQLNHYTEGVGDTPLEAVQALCERLKDEQFASLIKEMDEAQTEAVL